LIFETAFDQANALDDAHKNSLVSNVKSTAKISGAVEMQGSSFSNISQMFRTPNFIQSKREIGFAKHFSSA